MKKEFNVEQETNNIINWIKSLGLKGVVVGISGGKDSTVVSALLTRSLGVDNVLGVLIPNYIQLDIQDMNDSYKVIDFLGIRSTIVNIGNVFNSVLAAIGCTSKDAVVNITPRLRMTVLYAISQTKGYRVAGTVNASEGYVGYTTKWGDCVCDFNPIGNYTTEEVIAIGKYLGIPNELVEKTPNDGLSGKSDEEKLGVTYKEINKMIQDGTTGCFETDTSLKNRYDNTRHKFDPIPTCPRL